MACFRPGRRPSRTRRARRMYFLHRSDSRPSKIKAMLTLPCRFIAVSIPQSLLSLNRRSGHVRRLETQVATSQPSPESCQQTAPESSQKRYNSECHRPPAQKALCHIATAEPMDDSFTLPALLRREDRPQTPRVPAQQRQQQEGVHTIGRLSFPSCATGTRAHEISMTASKNSKAAAP